MTDEVKREVGELLKLIAAVETAQQRWRKERDDYEPNCPFWRACEDAEKALLAHVCRNAAEVRLKAGFYLRNEESREFMENRDELRTFLGSLLAVERT